MNKSLSSKFRKLRSSANFLLAITSLFEMLHQHGHFLFLYVAFSGRNFIDLQLAIRLGTPSLFGIFAIASLMLFTGIDRLIAVTMPIL
jgi:hypothetical protein